MKLRGPRIIRRLVTTLVMGVIGTVATAWILIIIGPTLSRLGPSYVHDDGRNLWEVRYSSTLGFHGSVWHAKVAWLYGATAAQRQQLVDHFTHNDPDVIKFPVLRPWPPSLTEPYLEVVRANHSFATPHAPEFKTIPDEYRSFAAPTTGAYFSVRKWGVPFPAIWCASDMQGGQWIRDAGSIGFPVIQRPMFSSAGVVREARFPYYIDPQPFAANVGVYAALWMVGTWGIPSLWRRTRERLVGAKSQRSPMSNDQSSAGPSSPEPASQQIKAALNYLRWLAAEDDVAQAVGQKFSAETALEWFCLTLQRPVLPVLKARYAALAGTDHRAAVFPAEEKLVEKVLVPLHQAKAAFVLGHELGCIALSGMVAEMLATLRFQVSPHGSGPAEMSKNQQKRLFGDSFEELQHSRRLGVLELLGLIDLDTGTLFREMAAIRNKYLHRFSHPHSEMAKDAHRSYQLAATLAVNVLGLGVTPNGAKVDPEVLAYIKGRPPENGTTGRS